MGRQTCLPENRQAFLRPERDPIVSPYTGEVVEIVTGKSRAMTPDEEDAATKKKKAAETAESGQDDGEVKVEIDDDLLEDDEEDNVSLDDIADVARRRRRDVTCAAGIFPLIPPAALTTDRSRLAAPQDRGLSSAGRALAWHARGQGFDPPRLHQSEVRLDGFESTPTLFPQARKPLNTPHVPLSKNTKSWSTTWTL